MAPATDWQERYGEKVRTAEQAMDLVRHGDRVFIGSGAAEPQSLVQALQIFRIKTQRTWIAATEREIVCVLDSAKTAARGRLIQWREPLWPPPIVTAKPRAGKTLTGVVSIGRRQNWLFSTKLFASERKTPSRVLEEKLDAMFEAARRS